jgi:putative phage-type endonuclease
MLTIDQLKMRQTGITATDITVIAGLSHFASVATVYESKFHDEEYLRRLVMKSSMTQQALNGHFFENALAQRYCHDLPYNVAIALHKTTYRAPDCDWALATPDRFVYCDPDAEDRADKGEVADYMLECKLVGSRMSHDWLRDDTMNERDRVPPYVYTQAQWQMRVLGYDRCDIAVLIDGTSFARFLIERDDDYIASLNVLAEDFWTNNILRRKVPAPDGRDAYTKFLQRRYPKALVGMLTEVPRGGVKLAQEYDVARKKEAEAVNNKKILGQSLFLMIGSSSGFKGDWGVVKTYEKRGKIDYEAFVKGEKIDKEILEKYRSEPTRQIYIKVKGKESE